MGETRVSLMMDVQGDSSSAVSALSRVENALSKASTSSVKMSDTLKNSGAGSKELASSMTNTVNAINNLNRANEVALEKIVSMGQQISRLGGLYGTMDIEVLKLAQDQQKLIDIFNAGMSVSSNLTKNYRNVAEENSHIVLTGKSLNQTLIDNNTAFRESLSATTNFGKSVSLSTDYTIKGSNALDVYSESAMASAKALAEFDAKKDALIQANKDAAAAATTIRNFGERVDSLKTSYDDFGLTISATSNPIGSLVQAQDRLKKSFDEGEISLERYYSGLTNLTPAVEKPISAFDGLGRSIANSLGKTGKTAISGFVTGLIGASTPMGVVANVAMSAGTALASAAKQGWDFGQVLTAQETKWKTMANSAEQARQVLTMIKDVAKETPFSFEKTNDTMTKLWATMKDPTPEKVKDAFYVIGNAAAASGADVDRIGKAYTDMMGAAKINAQDMRQLTEAGIPAWEMLAQAARKGKVSIEGVSDASKVTAADMRKFSADSRISGDSVGALWEQIAKAPAYQGQMQALTDTFPGQKEKLSDSISIILGEAGKNLQENLLPYMKEANGILDNWGQKLENDSVFKELTKDINSSKDAFVQYQNHMFHTNEQTDTLSKATRILKDNIGDSTDGMDAGVKALAEFGRKYQYSKEEMLEFAKNSGYNAEQLKVLEKALDKEYKVKVNSDEAVKNINLPKEQMEGFEKIVNQGYTLQLDDLPFLKTIGYSNKELDDLRDRLKKNENIILADDKVFNDRVHKCQSNYESTASYISKNPFKINADNKQAADMINSTKAMNIPDKSFTITASLSDASQKLLDKLGLGGGTSNNNTPGSPGYNPGGGVTFGMAMPSVAPPQFDSFASSISGLATQSGAAVNVQAKYIDAQYMEQLLSQSGRRAGF